MIKIDYSDLKKIHKQVSKMPDNIKTNFARAVNKGLSKARTNISRDVRERYTKINASSIRESIKLTKANKTKLDGDISIKNTRTPIQDAILRTKKRTKTGKIRVNIKDNKIKLLSNKGKYKPFIIKTKTGKTIVVRRTSDKPYPLTQIKTLSIPQMVRDVKISNKIINKTNEFIKKEFERLVDLNL